LTDQYFISSQKQHFFSNPVISAGFFILKFCLTDEDFLSYSIIDIHKFTDTFLGKMPEGLF